MSKFKSYRKPQSFNAYFHVHDSYMDDFKTEGLVVDDKLETEPDEDPDTGLWYMSGEIHINGGLRMTVEKTLRSFEAADGRTYIYTVQYSYNLTRQAIGKIFRYCSPHGDDGPKHHIYHHKHIYEPEDKLKEIQLIVDKDWPTLGEAIREAADHIK